MKHTPSLLDKVAASAATFVFALSLGYGAGEAIVDSTDGGAIGAYILRRPSSSSSSSVRRAVRKPAKTRKIRGVRRSTIVRPSRRQTGSILRERASSSRTAIKASCGDKLLIADLGEECDDGNVLGGDGCSVKCEIETGFTCAGRPSVCTARCGDGIVTPAEKCDDGNLNGDDGCSAVCKIEFGYVCSDSPSECEPTPYCGDGVKASTEQCDDGNSAPGDGCHLCKTE